LAWYYQRLDRLKQIIAYAVKNNIKGTDTKFASCVIQVCASFGIHKKTGREYLETLITAYKFNKWKSYLIHNKYIEKEDVENWINANIT